MSTPPASDETVFAAALQRNGAERAAYLDEACAGDAPLRARVESLLRAHERAESAFLVTAASPVRIQEPAAGTMIDRYKLLQKIGEGGCGTVYMAEQEEPVRRRVALKIIKLGMDTKDVIARFEAERQALAMMDHPNIARVLDAGATATGRPYFVMELVRGVKVTEYCDQNNLPTHERLELFIQICHAVQHAHQKGIIHRDIKPSNILVTLHDGKPVPKVIDFGIAKATAGRLTDNTLFTAFEQFIGTPAYMSPEQAEMSGLDIDTRSDIYSLGVLLYELLTGRTPFDTAELLKAGLDTMRRHIREVDPPKPSTRLSTMVGDTLTTAARQRATAAPKLVNLIRGDLDWIVMKALEKNRARRYETANSFVNDIRRHLANEPVNARPPSTAYRLGKTIRRHKLAFFATGAIAAALVVGLGVATWMFLREKEARERAVVAELEQTRLRKDAESERARAVTAERTAKAEAEVSRAVSSFLTNDLLRQADVGNQFSGAASPNANLTMREALDRAARTIGSRFQDQPIAAAAVSSAIAEAYLGVGEREKAVAHYLTVVRLRTEALGPEDEATLRSMSNLAWAYHLNGDPHGGEELATKTLAAQKRRLGPEHENTLATATILSNILGLLGRRAESDALRTEVLEVQERRHGPMHPMTLSAKLNMASSHLANGKNAEAEALSTQAWVGLKRTLDAEHPNTLKAMTNLGAAYLGQRKFREAEKLLLEVLELEKAINGAEHPSLLVVIQNLALAQEELGKQAEAANLRKEALAIANRVHGKNHPSTARAMVNLAVSKLNAGQFAEAEQLSRQALAAQHAALGAEHRDTVASLGMVAGAAYQQGKLAEAERLYAQQHEILLRTRGNEHAATFEAMDRLSDAYRAQGRFAESIRLRSQLLEIQDRKLGPKHADTLATMRKIAHSEESQGKLAAAEARLREIIARAPDPLSSPQSMLGWVLVKQGRAAEGEAVLRPIMADRDARQPNLWTTFVSRFAIGSALTRQGKFAEAEPLAVSAAEGLLERAATVPPVDKIRIREALEEVVRLYSAWSKPEQAASWQKKLDEFNEAARRN